MPRREEDAPEDTENHMENLTSKQSQPGSYIFQAGFL